MKKRSLAVAVFMALVACSAPKPPQPYGSWQPVNHRGADKASPAASTLKGATK